MAKGNTLGLVILVAAGMWGWDKLKSYINPAEKAVVVSHETSRAPARPPVVCDHGSPVNDTTIYRPRRNGVTIRSAPGADALPVMRPPAEQLPGLMGYDIGPETHVAVDCRAGDWSRIHVVDPPSWTNHKGWIASQDVVTEEEFVKIGLNPDNVVFDKQTEPYKDSILRAMNRLLREHPMCKIEMDLAPTLSARLSTPQAPSFFVACGRPPAIRNVYFSYSNIDGVGAP